ncbi:MAG: ATP-binding cassette domain-containing protein [Thermodesulfobacteriota bacterium]
MNELLSRLRARPALYLDLLAASLLVNLLAFADTIFVMILLRRYLTYGFDATLLVLTAGTLAALAMQYGLSRVRLSLAARVSPALERAAAEELFASLAGARTEALDALPPGRAVEAAQDLEAVRAAYDGPNLVAVLDAPFALLFVAATWALSPLMAGVVLVGAALSLWAAEGSGRRQAQASRDLAAARTENRALMLSASTAADTLRAFSALRHYGALWRSQSSRLAVLRRRIADTRGLGQAAAGTAGLFARVGVYAVGAVLVVRGELTFAALIGASILGGYAVQRVVMLASARALLAEAAEARARLDELAALPAERRGGARPEGYAGDLRLTDLSFAFPGSPAPLFSGLSLTLPPGGVLAVRGFNGCGKTTLLRLLAGLVEPAAGRIEAGGLDLAGWDLAHWRAQLCYMPQEPFFLGGTVRDNLTMANPDLPEAALNSLIRTCGLRRFLDLSDKGLDGPVNDGGRDLPLGIRRRMALVRALAGQGPLLLLDEPTEGLDAEGVQAVYAALNDLVREGRTVVAVSSDPGILRAAHLVLDLGASPAALAVQRPFAAPGGKP